MVVVTQCRKTVWKINPVSGHEWPEYEYLEKWCVSGGLSNRIFKSEKAAQEWADYLNSNSKMGVDHARENSKS